MARLHSFSGAVAVGLLVGAIALGTGFIAKAWPHDALPTAAKPQGWSYSFACCANYDCESVPASAVVEGARGYEIRKTGELIQMSDKRIKDSPDGQFHWCAHRAGLDAGKTICLFVPPRAF
ncbi:hypothetical protein [Mesorhizobium sp. M0129]|uniref:hypothetical protein n=1 Tax=Mesorhizobium sp. M0129 TaxID=2956886 RepID=UPI003335E669